MKVIDKFTNDGRVVFSFEFYTPRPPKQDAAAAALDATALAAALAPEAEDVFTTITRMAAHGSAFCDITWRPTKDYPSIITLDLASRVQNDLNVDTMLHLTCVNMPLARLNDTLDTARNLGIHNILVIKGDIPKKHVPAIDEFACALDLVRHIRQRHGDYFCIAVAGYPEAHPSKIPNGATSATTEGYESDLMYLKAKMDAGADLIITQAFFDVEVFLKFVGDCRRIGILCPVVPGILSLATYGHLQWADRTRIAVPEDVREAVEAIKGDGAALEAYGVELVTEICRKLLSNGVRELHFFTMNKDAVTVAVLRNLGLLDGEADIGLRG